MGKHILIIEDDKKLNDGMKLALQTDHYLFTQCRKLFEARAFCLFMKSERPVRCRLS